MFSSPPQSKLLRVFSTQRVLHKNTSLNSPNLSHSNLKLTQIVMSGHSYLNAVIIASGYALLMRKWPVQLNTRESFIPREELFRAHVTYK